MHTTQSIRIVADDEPVAAPKIVLFQLVRGRQPGDSLRRAIARARQALLAVQQADGGFADPKPIGPRSLATLALCRVFLEQHEPSQLKSIARALLEAQRADGGWVGEVRGGLDLSASVLAYFALKLSGQSPASEPMVCARRAILSRGGATDIDTEAKTWLALFGQVPYAPKHRSFAAVSEDAERILNALRPRRYISDAYGIRELLVAGPRRPARLMGTIRNRLQLVARKRTTAAARNRLLEQLARWAKLPPHDLTPETLAITLVALDSLGLTADTKPRRAASSILEALVDFEAEPNTVRCSADSATAAQVMSSLAASGLDHLHAGVQQGLQWLSTRRFTKTADAALALLANAQSQGSVQDALPPPLKTYSEDETTDLLDRLKTTDFAANLMRSLLATQRRDGAWPAELAPNMGRRRAKPDLWATAWTMIALAAFDTEAAQPALIRATAWLRDRQQHDGSWRIASRSAVEVTSLVLRAFAAAELDSADDAVSAGASWLRSHQQPGGGWGDTEPDQQVAIAGEGPPTAGHTAAALLGLLASGQETCEAVADGVRYLLTTQSPAGQWPSATGGVLTTAEPLLALASYARRV